MIACTLFTCCVFFLEIFTHARATFLGERGCACCCCVLCAVLCVHFFVDSEAQQRASQEPAGIIGDESYVMMRHAMDWFRYAAPSLEEAAVVLLALLSQDSKACNLQPTLVCITVCK